jgi:hypothetical protein
MPVDDVSFEGVSPFNLASPQTKMPRFRRAFRYSRFADFLHSLFSGFFYASH